MTVDTCGPITTVYNCPRRQDLSTFLTLPCQINQGTLHKTMHIEYIRSDNVLNYKLLMGMEKEKLKSWYFRNWGQIQVSNMSSGGLEEFPLHQLSSIYYTRRNFSHFVAKCEVIKGEAGAKSVRKCFPLKN